MSRFASRLCRVLLFSGVSCVVACVNSTDDTVDNPPVIDAGYADAAVDSASRDVSSGQSSDSQNETGENRPDALADGGTDAVAAEAGNRDAAPDTSTDTGRADTGGQDAGRPDGARDAGTSDTGLIDVQPVPDARLPETGTVDASVPDAVPDTSPFELPDAAVIDASDATVVDASDVAVVVDASDAAVVDEADVAVVDAVDVVAQGVVEAGITEAGGGGPSPCPAFNGGGGCTPTEQRFVDRSPDCYNCMATAGCLNDVLFGDTGHECSDVTGNAAAGAKTGTSRQQLCLDALDCALQTSCGSVDVAICYCGSLGAGNACATAPAGAPDGLCLQQELDGLERLVTDAPSVVLPNFTELGLGAGIANQLFNCAKANDCTALCFP